ncbi:hypothetical protein Strop_1157 [Salinispora tropica CNB-440]|uniref:F5/8 type C domain-containing protein n=1 Tax=Salinispora tropica (strain ATCC BAA-916 / DSM 44818 / JCM 13857 / NBRC 105044 / CNB-440) TaxID=369723 RepID=A4X427_SALTO|nr:hypothetical protein Strop_1157 [Salinispora tropica CNB-440]
MTPRSTRRRATTRAIQALRTAVARSHCHACCVAHDPPPRRPASVGVAGQHDAADSSSTPLISSGPGAGGGQDIVTCAVRFRDGYHGTSRDGTTWSTVRSVTTGTRGTVRIDACSALARDVRVLGVQRATGWGYSLWEIEVRLPVPLTPTSG